MHQRSRQCHNESYDAIDFITRELLRWLNISSRICFNRRGEVTELIPLHTDYLKKENRNGKKIYIYTDPENNNKQTKYGEQDLFKVYAPFRLSVIGAAREAVGLQLAQEQYAAKFFSNYAAPRGVIQFKGNLGEDDEAISRWKKHFVDSYAGPANSWGVAVLENGAEFKPISISMQDADFIESRKYQDRQICGLFPVPPHKVGILDDATYSNIEHQEQSYVNTSIVPWKVILEESVRRDLLTPAEKNRYQMEIMTQGLLRGDLKARNEAYAVARTNGWMSANDILRKENENPIPGGDEVIVPLNMIPLRLLEEYLMKIGTNNAQKRDSTDVNVLVENNQAQDVKTKVIRAWRGPDGEINGTITPQQPLNGVGHNPGVT